MYREVHLLPELQSTYITGTANDYETKLKELTKNWTVKNEGLKVEDIIPIISNDITNSLLMRPKLSNEAIWYLNKEERITSQINKAKMPTHIEIDAQQYGLSRDSVILLEQVRTIDKQRLREKIGRLDELQMIKVNDAISVSFGLV